MCGVTIHMSIVARLSYICQDRFNSEGELQKPELLNNVWDLASLCVVHPCLNSPQCPKIGQGVGKGWRCSALAYKAIQQEIKTKGSLRGE